MRPLWLALLALLLVCRPASATEPAGKSTSGAAIIREINLARQRPRVYLAYLEELRNHFQGKILILPGHAMLRTREGVGAVEEAIRFLQHTRPLGPLTFSPGISMAAAEHVTDRAAGALGHSGSDRSNPGDRMNRHGTWKGLWGENLSYGKTNARDVVVALIVDDGLRGRKHRKNIFNPAFNFAGAAVGAHARYRVVCSIDFAAGYVEGAPLALARN